ncbi:MAG: hypothetical protein KGH72_00160 [Candidatus Micrarchaeota archaeon]|nr:hypothetical protein [Candidatus Micrarchaeota archaeon]
MTRLDYFRNPSIIVLIVLVVMLSILDATYGLHLGVEFVGGTNIPLTLAGQINPNQLNDLINTLQSRLSTFGLKQITIEAIGTSEVDVQIATVSQQEIQNTINIIQSQGIFQGIVNGRVAVNGSSILPGSIGAQQPIQTNRSVTWAVNFYVNPQAAVYFSKVAFGQGNKPLYFFLDRPTGTIVLLNTSLLNNNQFISANSATLGAINNATRLGNKTIPVELLNPAASNWNTLYKFFASSRGRYSKVLLQNNTPSSITENLSGLNYTLVYQSRANMTPIISPIQGAGVGNTSFVVSSWPAIGLVSAPILNPGVTNGSISSGYTINGAAPPNMTLDQATAYATQQAKEISTILSGGSLPVQVIVGVPTVVQPTLGASFERISIIALLLAVIAVASVIVIRYRKLFLIAPILLTTLGEMFIILSIVGLIGTIDLAAIAGIIAVIGTGVDAQIIISDELLYQHNDNTAMKIKLGNAFYIVWADAALLVVAMLPLFFSTSLVSVIGFSESTIIGALLGAFVTRPSYGAILSRHYAK